MLIEAHLEPGRTAAMALVKILNFLGPLKMVLWEILQNSQENICVGISFFDKVNSVDLQL